MKKNLLVPALLSLLFLMLAGLGCREENPTLQGPGTETVGLHGTAVYPDGSPARNAAVIVRSARYLSKAFPQDGDESAKGTIVTDSLGRYKLDSLAPGDYAIEVRDSNNQAALVRYSVAAKTSSSPPSKTTFLELPPAQLLHLAAVSGQLQRPLGVKVHAVLSVYGLERRIFNDYETGKFLIPDLPQGDYTLHVTSLDPVQGGLDVSGIHATAKSNLDVGGVLLDSVREDYSTWAHSRKVNLRAGNSGAKLTETLTDFPVPIKLNDADFPFDSVLAPSGSDLRFANAAGVPLRYEIEAWDAAHHNAVIWVRVDSLRKDDDDQFIRMYWGKPGSEDLSFGRLVFDTALGYSSVWHLNENPRVADRMMDATANGNHARSPNAYATDTNFSPLYQGVYFDGRHGYLATDQVSRAPASFTISLWFQAFSDGKLIGFQNTPDGTEPTRFDRHFWIGKQGWIQFGVNSLDTSKYDPNQRYDSYTDGYSDDWKWHHVAATLAPDSRLTLYYDGVKADQDTATRGAEDYFGYWTMGTGSLSDWSPIANHKYFYGALDEVRIEQTARSAEWIRLSYETQKSGSNIVVIVPE